VGVIVRAVSKEFAKQNLLAIAKLRINVFKEFPYIYEGSLEYEVTYLQRYFDAPNAHFILAIDEKESNIIVGVATCLPLAEEDDFVKKSFIEKGYKTDEIFYFGESVLLKEYRGKGLGQAFFDAREKIALKFPKINTTTFCAVTRTENHHLKPANYKPLNEFWKKRGYEKVEGLTSQFEWLDLGEKQETEKTMQYWMKIWNQ
jgi:GNAT superfamily N-acetyltransferase